MSLPGARSTTDLCLIQTDPLPPPQLAASPAESTINPWPVCGFSPLSDRQKTSLAVECRGIRTLNAILYRTGSRGWPLNLADDQIWSVARQGRFLGAQMARLAAMFCAMKGAQLSPAPQ